MESVTNQRDISGTMVPTLMLQNLFRLPDHTDLMMNTTESYRES